MSTALTFVFRFFQLIGFVILTWILIHLIAVFGVIIAVGYPIWWMFFPGALYCFFCSFASNSTMCQVCRVPSKSASPKKFVPVLINSAFILLITALCIGLVYMEQRVIMRGFGVKEKTVHLTAKSNRTIYAGKIHPLKIVLEGIKTPINAVRVDMRFNPEEVEVVDFITKDSFADIFIEKQIDNKNGFFRITGGVPNPGYNATVGLFGTVMLRPKISGHTTIEFLPSSVVMANDGRGSDVLFDFDTVSYLVLPATDDTAIDSGDSNYESLVLGEQSDKAKLTFFDEPPAEGTTLGTTVTELPQPTLQDRVIDWLYTLNTQILTLWGMD